MWRGIVKARDAVARGFHPRLGTGNSSLWYNNWLGTRMIAQRIPFVHITDTNLCVADLWRHGGWDFNQLYTQLPDEIKHEISIVQIPQQPVGVDKILWHEENDGKYT
ncbi:uncharacterized protein LOC130725592 [Lotus japonicus]|uniref:uncharacterized protein LOC130725592 n=1 Tax=Lotus japonicus TaxID=34305 RepID=UPI00258489F4|nr:uncharacterized protein LOC130725592 [Lotus japonicus]